MRFTVNQWSYTRAKLKKQFEANGITRCEQCGTGNYLSFAHRLKRRFITTKEELATVALLCQQCHARLEYGPKEEMYNKISEIIRRRDTSGASSVA